MDKQALKMIREELRKTVEKSDLAQTHRIGAFQEDKNLKIKKNLG